MLSSLVWGPFYECGLMLWMIIAFPILWLVWREINERIFRGSLSTVDALISRVDLRIVKWSVIQKEFFNFNLNDILFNWEACMGCG